MSRIALCVILMADLSYQGEKIIIKHSIDGQNLSIYCNIAHCKYILI